MTGPSYQMIGKQCRLEKHSIYLRKVSYKRKDGGGGGLTGFNLILSAAQSSASIIPLGPWAGQVLSGVMVLIISQGLVCASLSPLSWLLTSHLCVITLVKESVEENQLKMGSLVRLTLTDHEFFIEILLLIYPLLRSLLITSYSWDVRCWNIYQDCTQTARNQSDKFCIIF